MMIDILTSIFLLLGAGLMFIAGLGILRMPDLPIRMHATTKAGALGGGLMVVAVGIYYFDDGAVVARAVAIVIFIILTAPVAAHVIGRAGYFCGVPLWKGTIKDELKGRYDPDTHILASGLEEEEDGTADSSSRSES